MDTIESLQMKEARIQIDTLSSDKDFGEGTYKMSDVKKMTHIYAYICVYPRISTNIHIYTRISTLILYICAYPRISSHDYGVETVANPSAPTREWLDLCRSLLRPATRPVAMVYIINIYHNLVGGFVG